MDVPLNVQIYDGNNDGHTRITQAETFVCRGGSSDSHEATVEAVIHVRERLQRRGKDFGSAAAVDVMDQFRDEFERK